MLEEKLQVYLQSYLDTLPDEAPQRTAPTDAWSFGDSPELADELGQLVMAGVKTSTCGALWEYEAEGWRMPEAGMLTVILWGNGEPLGIIETTGVEIKPFNQVDAQFAYEEGEDDRTLASWRREHWRYFTRTLAAAGERQPSEEMPLVCVRFRLVYPVR